MCRIVKSRFKKDNIEPFVVERRKECAKCEYNSLNAQKVPYFKRVLIMLSDFYSFITGNKEEDSLGNCLACEACSIYYKSAEELEDCKLGKWKSRQKNQ